MCLSVNYHQSSIIVFTASAVYAGAEALIQRSRTPFRYHFNIIPSHVGSRSIQTFLPFQLVRTSSVSIPTRVTSSLFQFQIPAGHVLQQQFNIPQLYVLPTLYLCVLYLSENKQRLVPLTA